MKRVFFRMDELLLESDEWKELIKPRRDCIQFLKSGGCTNYWPFTQEIPYLAPQGTGSTACIVVVRGNLIVLGNVGDSRFVISKNGQAIQVTTDHKPNEVTEKKRILRAGGKVLRRRIPVVRGGLVRYQLGPYRINGILAVSRVIGDFEFKQNKNLPPERQAATCKPDLFHICVSNDLEFLVIASDGIWDCMSPDDVVGFVHKYLRMGITDLRDICEKLVQRALRSGDNATVILIQFKSNAARLPRLTDSDSGGRQGETTTSANRNGRAQPTVVEEEEQGDDATPPSAAEKENEQQDDEGEAGASETAPLLGAGSGGGGITEE